jgi:uncharacterized SAM-binding protein YcdF (DUF218 family)
LAAGNSIMTDNQYELIKTLWRYNYVPSQPSAADVLIVMGTDDLGVPRYAAKLAAEHSYKAIVVSGGVLHQYSPHGEPFGGTEAEVFREVLLNAGCPDHLIHLENRARNTGANVLESRSLLTSLDIDVTSGQLVHTPTMQRRALATAQKQWEDVHWKISGEPTTLDAYVSGRDFERFTHALVGDTYRIWHYPSKGFQVEQSMPDDVKAALKELLTLGYTRTLREGYSLFGL